MLTHQHTTSDDVNTGCSTRFRPAAATATGLAAALAALALSATTPALAHETTAYSHESTIGLTSTDWMKPLSDATRLSELSIPGTHDSGAYRWGGTTSQEAEYVLTQSMNLAEQLKSGIRAWTSG